MSKAKTRNFLVKCHLWAAGLLAPLFILVAYTGAAYLLDFKGEVAETPLALPAGTTLDPESPTIEEDIRKILAASGADVKFESVRGRGGSLTTRPTSRTFASFEEKDGVWTATLKEPNLQYALIELHKGHGPALYRWYQVLAAVALFFVVVGGLVVGWMAPGYRRATSIGLGIGTIAFVFLGFIA